MILAAACERFFWERWGERGTIERMAQAGFDAIDYTFCNWMEYGASPWTGDDYAEHAKEIKRIADDNGIFFNQTHAPIRFDMSLLPDWNREILPMVLRSMEICAILKAPHIVIHPLHHVPYGQNREYLWQLNQEYYQTLLPHAKRLGIKLALENLVERDASPERALVKTICSDPQDYAAFYDELGDNRNVICCVDTGHAALCGESAAEMIRSLGSRVGALHIHDNDFVSDKHWIPYQGKIDWDDVLRALADVGYQGDFTFEVLDTVFGKYEERFLPTVLRFLHDLGRSMICRLEEYNRGLQGI